MSTKTNRKVLLLNRQYMPRGLVTWQDAMCLVSRDTVRVVEYYDDWTINSAHQAHKVPAVLVMKNKHQYSPSLKFTRENVYFRDEYTCQYCGVLHAATQKRHLTYDHVLPRSRGGGTSWQNIVTCCKLCNVTKGNKLPREANMPLLKKPTAPSQKQAMQYRILNSTIQEKWKFYIQHIL